VIKKEEPIPFLSQSKGIVTLADKTLSFEKIAAMLQD
jgi:hypothetical protein